MAGNWRRPSPARGIHDGGDAEDGGVQIELEPEEFIGTAHHRPCRIPIFTSNYDRQADPPDVRVASAAMDSEIARLWQESMNGLSRASDCVDGTRLEYACSGNTHNDILDSLRDTAYKPPEPLLMGGFCQLCSDGTGGASKSALTTPAMSPHELAERRNAILEELVRRGLIIPVGRSCSRSHDHPALPSRSFSRPSAAKTAPDCYRAHDSAGYQNGGPALAPPQPRRQFRNNNLVMQMIALATARVPEIKCAIIGLEDGARNEFPYVATVIQLELQNILDRFGGLQDESSRNLCQRAARFLASMSPYLAYLVKSDRYLEMSTDS